MSFKIFSLQLTGKIKPLEKIEKQRETLLKNYQEFLAVEKSDELKEYLELESFVTSSEFKKKRAEIEVLQFKGSKEFNELTEFARLQKAKRFKRYFKIAGSQELARFEGISSSEKPKAFLELKEYVSGGKFAQDKKDKKEEALSKRDKFKQLKADSELRFYFKFKKSSLYKNYLDVSSSSELKRYEELKELTVSKEFLERKAYLEDKKKWEKTEEFKKQQRYDEIKKLSHIQNYFKYKDSADFDFFKNWSLTFEDDFSGLLDGEKWTTINKWSEKLIGENYSLPGDLHCFTSGKNIKTGGKLSIEVKKESVKGKMWQMPAGFVETNFDYTSGLVSSLESFGEGDEIFEAKIRFSPTKQIVSTLSLADEKNSFRVHLLEMGTKNRLGVSKPSGDGKMEMEGLDIANLKAGKWYIFTVEKSGSTLIWKINETEVFRLSRGDVKGSLFLNVASIVVHDVNGHQLPNLFEIEWIKCYHKK